MTPVRFWERDVGQAHVHRDINTSGLAPSWDPQNPPDDFNEARDDLLIGDMFSDEWPEPVRHPSQHLLDVTAASYPAALTARPSAGEPSSAPADGRATPSDDVQPGRGHDRAA